MTTNPDCTCTPFIPEPCPVCAAEIEQRNADPLGTMPAKDSLETQLYDRIETLEAQNARLLAALTETVQLLNANAIAISGEENHHLIVKRARAAIAKAQP